MIAHLRTSTFSLLILATAGPRALGQSDAASALDAMAVHGRAEARTYRLGSDGVAAFRCSVSSPHVDRLGERGGPLEGRVPRVLLEFRGPDRAALAVEGADSLPPALVESLLAFFAPVPEALFAPPPSSRLTRHEFRLLPGLEGSTVIEAVARDPSIEPASARFTVGAAGLIQREQWVASDGAPTDWRILHARVASRDVPVWWEGTWRGRPASLGVEWAAVLDGRPLPTRLVVRLDDGLGSTGETEFVLADHVVNGSPRAPAR